MIERLQKETSYPIQIRGLTKRYSAEFALESFDLDVRNGEFLTLLGPSGSGKTTLLMAIAGFTRPDGGSIRLGPDEIVSKPPHKRGIGVVFQNHALFPHMSVAENIAFPLKLRAIGPKIRRELVKEALEKMELTGFGGRKIHELSGGQSQRVALARALVFKPRVLLMDEPLSALDRKLREQMQIELRELQRTFGVTTVYVTHDQREALTISDRIAIISNGRLVQLGTPEEVYKHPTDAFVADFIGESATFPLEPDSRGNLLFRGQVTGRSDRTDGDTIWMLVLRPETLFVLSRETPKDDQTIALDGTVREILFQGDRQIAIVEVDRETRLSVWLGTNIETKTHGIRVGDEVTIGFRLGDAIIVPERPST